MVAIFLLINPTYGVLPYSIILNNHAYMYIGIHIYTYLRSPVNVVLY